MQNVELDWNQSKTSSTSNPIWNVCLGHYTDVSRQRLELNNVEAVSVIYWSALIFSWPGTGINYNVLVQVNKCKQWQFAPFDGKC